MKSKRQKPETGDKKEAYFLKVYRRSRNPEESLVGTIEDIQGEKKAAFKTANELLHWLEKHRANDNQ